MFLDWGPLFKHDNTTIDPYSRDLQKEMQRVAVVALSMVYLGPLR